MLIKIRNQSNVYIWFALDIALVLLNLSTFQIGIFSCKTTRLNEIFVCIFQLNVLPVCFGSSDSLPQCGKNLSEKIWNIFLQYIKCNTFTHLITQFQSATFFSWKTTQNINLKKKYSLNFHWITGFYFILFYFFQLFSFYFLSRVDLLKILGKHIKKLYIFKIR